MACPVAWPEAPCLVAIAVVRALVGQQGLSVGRAADLESGRESQAYRTLSPGGLAALPLRSGGWGLGCTGARRFRGRCLIRVGGYPMIGLSWNVRGRRAGNGGG